MWIAPLLAGSMFLGPPVAVNGLAPGTTLLFRTSYRQETTGRAEGVLRVSVGQELALHVEELDAEGLAARVAVGRVAGELEWPGLEPVSFDSTRAAADAPAESAPLGEPTARGEPAPRGEPAAQGEPADAGEPPEARRLRALAALRLAHSGKEARIHLDAKARVRAVEGYGAPLREAMAAAVAAVPELEAELAPLSALARDDHGARVWSAWFLELPEKTLEEGESYRLERGFHLCGAGAGCREIPLDVALERHEDGRALYSMLGVASDPLNAPGAPPAERSSCTLEGRAVIEADGLPSLVLLTVERTRYDAEGNVSSRRVEAMESRRVAAPPSTASGER